MNLNNESKQFIKTIINDYKLYRIINKSINYKNGTFKTDSYKFIDSIYLINELLNNKYDLVQIQFKMIYSFLKKYRYYTLTL